MIRFGKYFNKWFSRSSEAPDEHEAQRLRIAFKDRHHHFKLLLKANNQSLQKMADIERALHGHFEFSMAFVRNRCTSIAVNVLQMIKHMEHLAPEKYSALHASYTSINQRVNAALSVNNTAQPERLVIPMDAVEAAMVDLVGNKMARLADVGNSLGFAVPAGFVITTVAYERFIEETGLQDEINRLIQSADLENVEQLYRLSTRIRQRINQARFPPDIADAVCGAWSELEARTDGRLQIAMRSSALGEDAAGMSFAGQYDSSLNVRRPDLLDTYKGIVASKYNLQAIIYRLNRGCRDEEIPMAVGCLRMIDATAGGVTYSRNPLDAADDAVVINSVWGLPKTVVDGTAPCDLFMRSRTPPHSSIREEIRNKDIRYVSCVTDSGLCRVPADAHMAARPSLNDMQQIALSEIAVALDKYYGHAQDIEWAIDPAGTVYILQSRALLQQVAEAFSPSPATALQESQSVIIAGGIAASSGAACGEVFIVEKNADTLRFPRGAVLVARQALPAWASLVNRAAAVVTAQGGVAGHLASVAREFGIPALFGLQDDLDKLASGDRITVDADNQRIYAGCVDALIKERPASAPVMADRPVYHVLNRASKWIVPLNLLDPDAREFTPGNCRTYHDLTRFIHEKSVVEMFNFGKDHHFPERSGKQLYYHVPMQWWVLNLDDGFRDEVSGRYVRLENIISVPMLAFWEGFAAVPWDGPPSIDRKGLMAVMFQSTTNPALVTGLRSRYAEQNYFMISRNFCSLNSRLGYHFSTLESLVSERVRENYIGFQFKGGAADDRRRTRRTRFIGDILENYGFSVRIRDDHLSARLREEGLETMRQRLAILGYLTLHTRQLDMIMNNANQVAYYKSKLQKDIDLHILYRP